MSRTPSTRGRALPEAVGRSLTGTTPPADRSCQVPWLPPAGATSAATTCSIPNSVQAPQS